MGKIDDQQQQHVDYANSSSEFIFCHRFLVLFSSEFSFKCFFVLILTLSLFIFSIFCILPSHRFLSSFDANDSIKLTASVQAYFRLQRPVSLLVPRIGMLEFELNGEIGVPGTKVVILSMHQLGASNFTDVVFGVVPDPPNIPINPVMLSLLKSSFIELVTRQLNLTFTDSIFGQPSSFQILQFSGGITLIPSPGSFWKIPQILFNFTLHNSIFEIQQNFVQLEKQLMLGLSLQPYEKLYVLLTNGKGSTVDPPVTIQASIQSSYTGSLAPQRLVQLIQLITGSPAKNLGLDNSLFGEVKEVSLSSCLKRTIDTNPLAPTPTPTPEIAPSSTHSDPPVASGIPPHAAIPCPPSASMPFASPSPSPSVSYGSSLYKGSRKVMESSSSSSRVAGAGLLDNIVLIGGLCALLIYHLGSCWY